ncbi:MAG: tRNA pseudouridine(38-40) synthase TruA [Hyphomicrobiales bacterium]|nr:tRNA pseudouridine(38-40) synthase TruA [Hyphomicrobiales bacterium]
MPRFKLILEYDGSPFDGWQAQASGRSVQDRLEAALLKLTGERVRVRAAGRTDAGVHASHQVAHADLAKNWRPDTLRDALNAHLRPHPISVLATAAASSDFDARLSAIKRHYRYRILNRRAPPALEAGRVWHVPRLLDAEKMHEGAQLLVGRHDFTTFRAADCQARSPIKTLDRLDVARQTDEVVIYASARSFLHHQVRSLVGTIEMAGAGRWSLADVKSALEARDRSRCGPMAPAAGLCLIGVDYRSE